MTIEKALLKEYTEINDEQKDIISHSEGPLLVIAGPGSGKTFSLVLRAMNILLQKKAEPEELIICTFTEKSALELKNRISSIANKIEYNKDLSLLNVSTIHGLCSRIIMDNRHRTKLGHNYETLDDLSQLLFIFEHFKDIAGIKVDGKFLKNDSWKYKWRTIKELRSYFNKISEELIDPERLIQSPDSFISALGEAYKTYEKLLYQKNRIDFAGLQKIAYALLYDPSSSLITDKIKYIMVDEYQDTNYIQEQILLKLSEKTKNLFVVGDEDQSLYRFRGATVRNILEFPKHFPGCRAIKLTTNYRSHNKIIEAYDKWMASEDWTNPSGLPFRYDKRIRAVPGKNYEDYPSVFAIWGKDKKEEAEQFAHLVKFLREKKIIEDYSQVALLLYSVRQSHSKHYIEALEKEGIKSFCPRARKYFENEEIQLLMGCFALLFGYYGKNRGNVSYPSIKKFIQFIDNCLLKLQSYSYSHPLLKTIQSFMDEILVLEEGKTLDMRPADYFYRFIALEPFSEFIKDENKARNLSTFSELLNTFQNYYHYTVITYKNKTSLRFHFFNSFLKLLFDGGISEYEDPYKPFPKGYVQIITIHQSKGLEFPVVIAGSLNKKQWGNDRVEQDLLPFYNRPPFEPENRIPLFDAMRLHYVAFSRAEKILALTASKEPNNYFRPLWDNLDRWSLVKDRFTSLPSFSLKEAPPVKRAFSFTSDIKVYETCPRQYQFYREYEFTPSRSAVIFFGLLVHQTIEEIHRIILDGNFDKLTFTYLREIFEKAFYFLSLADVRAVGQKTKEAAFTQIMNYFLQNQSELKQVIETEVDVSLEKDLYILNGTVDLLLDTNKKLTILDFKTSPRPVDSPALISEYERQLCIYAHILEHRYKKKPERMVLYWTSESDKNKAVMEFPFKPGIIDKAGTHFDKVVSKIIAKEFDINRLPEARICKECDFNYYCKGDFLKRRSEKAPVSFEPEREGIKEKREQAKEEINFLDKVSDNKSVYEKWIDIWSNRNDFNIVWGPSGFYLKKEISQKEEIILCSYPYWGTSLLLPSDLIRLKMPKRYYEKYLSHIESVKEAKKLIEEEKRLIRPEAVTPEELDIILEATDKILNFIGTGKITVKRKIKK